MGGGWPEVVGGWLWPVSICPGDGVCVCEVKQVVDQGCALQWLVAAAATVPSSASVSSFNSIGIAHSDVVGRGRAGVYDSSSKSSGGSGGYCGIGIVSHQSWLVRAAGVIVAAAGTHRHHERRHRLSSHAALRIGMACAALV